MLFGENEYKSNTFIADSRKKLINRCIKTDFNIVRKIGEVLIEFDYFCRWEANLIT